MEFLALLRRNLLLVLVLAAGAVGVAAYQARQEVPRYRAMAVIRLVDKARALSGGIGRGAGELGISQGADPMLSQVQVLQSRAVAREVAARTGLRLRSVAREFPRGLLDSVSVSPSARNDTIQLRFRATDFAARWRGAAAWQQARYGAPLTLDGVRFVVRGKPRVPSALVVVAPLEAATGEVLGGLRGRPRERTDIVEVLYTGTDPVIAQRVANVAVAVFEENSTRTAKQQSVRRRQFIEQQLAKSELMLSEAQAAHNRFRTREQVYSSQDKFRAQQSDMLALELRRQELEADSRVYSRLLAELQVPPGQRASSEAIGALVSSPGIVGNPVVTQLYGQLSALQSSRDSLTTGIWARSPDHPDVRKADTLIVQTQGRIIAAVKGQIAGVAARLAALDELRQRAAGQLAVLPGTESEEASLLAQVQTYSREVERLRDETQKAQIDESAETGQVEIVDLATVPGVPIGSGPAPRLLIALLAGLGLGTAAAYLREQRNHSIRRRDELDEAIDAPNLAFVPQMRAARARRFRRGGQSASGGLHRELVLAAHGQSVGAEAYRTLRTNLLFSASLHDLRRVVVTSAGPAEGKTITAANLAVAFAQQGHRVLIIDADMRRARLHTVFDQSRAPGLTDLAAGRVGPDTAVRATRVDGLHFLPTGTTTSNPAELLGSAPLGAMLDRLSAEYDLVVLDTPPLLAASDAAILSRVTDGVVLVVRAGRTEQGALHEAQQQLATVGAHLLGTVLNDPDAEVEKYARYYGHYYTGYYDYSGATR